MAIREKHINNFFFPATGDSMVTRVLKVNIAFFSVVGILHLLRVIFDWQVSIMNTAVPRWINVIIIIVLGILIAFNWRAHDENNN